MQWLEIGAHVLYIRPFYNVYVHTAFKYVLYGHIMVLSFTEGGISSYCGSKIH